MNYLCDENMFKRLGRVRRYIGKSLWSVGAPLCVQKDIHPYVVFPLLI